MKTVKLIGGSRDGESIEIYPRQPLVYLRKRITMAEDAELKISETTSWKPPEEVYTRNDDGEFVYDRTVDYKPKE